MLQVSDLWRNTIGNQQVARRIRVMAQISLSDSMVKPATASITTPRADVSSKPLQLGDGIVSPEYAYASLDSSWAMGDDKRMSSNVYGQNGYVGRELAQAGGYMQEQTLVFRLTGETVVNTLTIAFDDKLNEYATEFSVVFFRAGGARVGTWLFRGNTQSKLTVSGGTHTPASLVLGTGKLGQNALGNAGTPNLTKVGRYELHIIKWCKVAHTAKVIECFAGQVETVSDNDRLLRAEVREELESGASIDPGTVPAATLNMTLDNLDDRYSEDVVGSLIAGKNMRNKRVQLWGGIEYDDESSEMLPMGTYYVNKWETSANDSVTIGAADLLATMDSIPYTPTTSLSYPATLGALARDVFAAAGYAVSIDLSPNYELFSVPAAPAWDANISCRDALKHIVRAVNGSIYQRRDGTVVGIDHLYVNDALNWFGPQMDKSITPESYYALRALMGNAEGLTRCTVKWGAEDAQSVTYGYWDEEAQSGVHEYALTGNPILQTQTTNALAVAASRGIVNYWAYFRRTYECDWRGDQACELSDLVRVQDRHGTIKSMGMVATQHTFDGGYRATTTLKY